MKVFLTVALIFSSIASVMAESKPITSPVDAIAESYVRIVLAMGQHDADYVDAYYGPPKWKTEAVANKKSLDQISAESVELQRKLAKLPAPAGEMERLRRTYLTKQLASLSARVRILQGQKMTFDEESHALYDAVAPTYSDAHFQKILGEIAGILKVPLDDRLSERYDTWRKAFVIPKEKLNTVFQLAIKECRARTLAHITLPPNESFKVEYVTDKPWGGYNWYKGDYHSVIQVNTDLPTYIDRAIDLAAHEGYPGHHVYNALLEKNLVRDRGWVEFSVYPLYSPQSLIAEGTANFGRDMVMTKPERLAFERKVLWPAAGLDPTRAEEYYAVEDLVKKLSYASNEAARRLQDGKSDEAATIKWLEKYMVLDPAEARHRLKFIEHYRSYVINYNLGEAMVRSYVERLGGTAAHPEKRWEEFSKLLSSPRLPSEL